MAKLGALLARGALKRLQRRIDPRRVNGGVFLGLNGTVVKSHGSADATGVSAAIRLAAQLAEARFPERLAARVASAVRRGAGCRKWGAEGAGQGADPTDDDTRRGQGRRALPARTVVPNSEFEAIVDTSDEWIRSRSGIERRHFAAEGQLTSDLATRAAQAALADAGLEPADIDAIIVATSTADLTFPSCATMVQARLA
jgi:hypothetical protein